MKSHNLAAVRFASGFRGTQEEIMYFRKDEKNRNEDTNDLQRACTHASSNTEEERTFWTEMVGRNRIVNDNILNKLSTEEI